MGLLNPIYFWDWRQCDQNNANTNKDTRSASTAGIPATGIPISASRFLDSSFLIRFPILTGEEKNFGLKNERNFSAVMLRRQKNKEIFYCFFNDADLVLRIF